ncbi:MAG: metabolite traffic protein EboE [Luteitalea sp.]|nr:metabolite traffic protein EboE [Luteitalea sp.]
MRIKNDGFFHLTYCTNIHAADGWGAVYANLRRYAPALKRRLCPAAPFGVGLRLSAREARELLQEGRLDDFREFLASQGLYVALLNGFPYGAFHGAPVKANVYAPDWRDEARVRYTLDLIEILSGLLPEGLDGGISTSPLSYKPWMLNPEPDAWTTMTRNVSLVAEALVRVRRQHGKLIHLDIEPEPDCLLENSADTVAFFERWLLPVGGAMLADALGTNLAEARGHLLDHVRVCFDCCHFATEYEDPGLALERLRAAGIQIGRVQLSSALRVVWPEEAAQSAVIAERLRPFADATYLHQVVESRGPTFHQYPDLDEALGDRGNPAAREWRVHFHVPLFTGEYDGLGSTQGDVRKVLETVWHTRLTPHLEIETYTWDVLPAGLKIDLLDSIAREYEWVLDTLEGMTTTS